MIAGAADLRPAWTPRLAATLAVGLGAAALLRIALLPTPGLSGDLDQFVLWVHGLATQPFGRAYDQNLSFPPIMVYVWGLLAAIEPAFRSAMDSFDPWIRAVMKAPASLADFGLGAGVAYALRNRPGWAVAGALGILLHPAVIDVSAWWGQYESIYVLAGLIAYLFAAGGHPLLAAVALAAAFMTKPQAAPFLVPFAAWYLARYGLRRSILYGVTGLATIVVLWLPFIGSGGPAAYLRNLNQYQGDIFAVLSLRAWNPWWLFQEANGHGEFIADSASIVGPVTLRAIGYLIAAILEAVVFLAVWRAPRQRTLALGLAASSLVAFCALTTMHERYAYPALVFLALLLDDKRLLALWLVLGLVTTLNVLAAAPPTLEIATALPISGVLGELGSVATTVSVGLLLVFLATTESRVSTTAPAIVAAAE
jgi:hypothetical protein